ncbi:hypothetical protein SL1157_1791 [Ruegeria lacuscaerulensis ITI-1157]|nr:hypothetical protein SL1157_1791 [Ruegeria lacuscaerulensis ITI-1157]
MKNETPGLEVFQAQLFAAVMSAALSNDCFCFFGTKKAD